MIQQMGNNWRAALIDSETGLVFGPPVVSPLHRNGIERFTEKERERESFSEGG